MLPVLTTHLRLFHNPSSSASKSTKSHPNAVRLHLVASSTQQMPVEACVRPARPTSLQRLTLAFLEGYRQFDCLIPGRTLEQRSLVPGCSGIVIHHQQEELDFLRFKTDLTCRCNASDFQRGHEAVDWGTCRPRDS